MVAGIRFLSVDPLVYLEVASLVEGLPTINVVLYGDNFEQMSVHSGSLSRVSTLCGSSCVP